MLSSLGNTYGKMGRLEEAREVLAELRERSRHEYVQSLHFSFIHAGLGDLEETLSWLEKAYIDRDLWLLAITMMWDPSFEKIRDDLRFKEYIEQIRASIR